MVQEASGQQGAHEGWQNCLMRWRGTPIATLNANPAASMARVCRQCLREMRPSTVKLHLILSMCLFSWESLLHTQAEKSQHGTPGLQAHVDTACTSLSMCSGLCSVRATSETCRQACHRIWVDKPKELRNVLRCHPPTLSTNSSCMQLVRLPPEQSPSAHDATAATIRSSYLWSHI